MPGDARVMEAKNDSRQPVLSAEDKPLEVMAEGIVLASRSGRSGAVIDEDATLRRARRLRRKRLAQGVVAHWKRFAMEGIADARARAHASDARTQRRALARWRRGVDEMRSRRLWSTAAAGRRRFLAESRGFSTWLAATRASRERRLLRSVAAAAAGAEALQTAAGIAAASRGFRRWRAFATAARARRKSARCARAHDARGRATLALHRWRGHAAVAAARRGVEAAAVRAWAAGRLCFGLAALRRHAERRRLGSASRDRADRARRRLLGTRGLCTLEDAVLTRERERDIVAGVEAGRARAALLVWARWAALRTAAARLLRAARANQARISKPVGPPQCRYGRNHRKENQNQDVDQDQSRNDRKASAARLEAAVGTGALNGAEEPAAVGRARALASLRRWRQGFTHRQGRREAAGLAEGFRDHVLLLRHHESWKASTRQGKAAAAVAAAATELGRRARMRRALLDLARGVEDAVERREVERPRLRQAFGAWADLVEERAMERYQREEERMGRDRQSLRLALAAWQRRTHEAVVARKRLADGTKMRRNRCLFAGMWGLERAAVEAKRWRKQAEVTLAVSDRRRSVAALRVWRAAAASSASRRLANQMARAKASKSFALRTVRAWRERAELQAARKAVFSARVASAAVILAKGRLRRSLGRWREVHGSARVAAIGRARAKGHAQRNVLGKFWRAWMAARDLQRKRKAFRVGVKARNRVSLQQQAFAALSSAAAEARYERERVRSALHLWKLHTQGKAFAALAAHCLRRWAATADALASSRISTAACREGNAATRRWEAAGRCAQHWRRVAAARAMERRALQTNPRNRSYHWDKPRVRRPVSEAGMAAPMVAAATNKGLAGMLPFGSVSVGGGGSRVGALGIPFIHGATGKENCARRGGYLGFAESAASADPAAAAVPEPLFPGHGGACDAMISSAYEARASCVSSSSEAAATVVAAGAAGVNQRRSEVGTRCAEAMTICPTLQSAPARRGPRVSTAGTDTSSLSGRSDSGPLASAHLGSGVIEGTSGRSTSLNLSAGRRYRVEPSFLLAPRHNERPPTTAVVMAASDLAQAPSTPSLGPVHEGQASAEATGGVAVAALPPQRSRPRPAPRRPLELLLDETSRYATTIAGEPSRHGLDGNRDCGAKPPLSTWVVDEMNRLFGVRSHYGNDPAAGERAPVYRGGEGRRPGCSAGGGGGSTSPSGEASTPPTIASARVVDDVRTGSAVGACVIGDDLGDDHAASSAQPLQPKPQLQPQSLPPKLRPGEQVLSPGRSSAETMVDAPTNSYGHGPLSSSGPTSPPGIEDEHGPCVTSEAVEARRGGTAGCEVPRTLAPEPISEEERALEERVADAERRLLALQERARLRQLGWVSVEPQGTGGCVPWQKVFGAMWRSWAGAGREELALADGEAVHEARRFHRVGYLGGKLNP
eukprot:jgi/Undpi1/315/HiC_scaffold_1.g00311.m1